jgi:F0F1-type ATP synthase assembly protein I
MPLEPSGRAPLQEALRYAQVGIMLVAPMVALGAAGFVLDRRFGSAPWLLLSGLVLGMAAGFVTFLRLVLEPPSGGRGRGRGQ